MKTVLLIAFFYPPMSTIGAQRPYRLAKCLPRFGWTPIVLTGKQAGDTPSGIRTVQTDYTDILAALRRAAGFEAHAGLHDQLGIPIPKQFAYQGWKSKAIKSLKDIIAYPDDQRGWRASALRAGAELIRATPIHALLSTSSPVTCHIIAARLKRTYGIPWIADLRDLWTQNHYYDKGRGVKYWERRLEVATLAGADALVTANPQVDTLRQLHKQRTIAWIPNGFDPDDFVGEVRTVEQTFTISYSGTLFNGKRDPAMLFAVVRQLIAEGRVARERIALRFYGDTDKWLDDEIAAYGLEGVVRNCGIIPREEVLKKQRESHVLLLLLWDNPKEVDICPGKLYEYLGAGRPVVALGGSGGIVKRILEATSAGRFADGEEGLRDIVLSYYQEFRRTGEVRSASNEKVAAYECANVARTYAGLLEEVTLGAGAGSLGSVRAPDGAAGKGAEGT